MRVDGADVRADDTFDALVNPGRHIPESSTRFHGISDELVADAPTGAVVLTDFADYAADSVLVGHHLAFDLGFLAPPAAEAGITLEPLSLDTMLLSAVLDPDPDARHGLDGVCARFGVEVIGRHTALGDALATAEVLVRMIPLLQGARDPHPRRRPARVSRHGAGRSDRGGGLVARSRLAPGRAPSSHA